MSILRSNSCGYYYVLIDKYAVAVLKDDLAVVHVPYNLARHFSLFLKRKVNKSFDEVNRGAGYGSDHVPTVCLDLNTYMYV